MGASVISEPYSKFPPLGEKSIPTYGGTVQ